MTVADDEVSRLIAAGNALEDRGELDAAQAHYLRAVALAPDAPRPWLNLGNVLERKGRIGEAIAAAASAVHAAPTFAPAHFNLGRLQALHGDAASGEASYRAALRCDPALVEPALGLADLLQKQHRGDDAIVVLREAVARQPAHAGAVYNLALALIDDDELDEAEALLAQVATTADACGAMANVCMRSGRVREAEAWLRRRIAARPESFEALAALVFSLLARDDLTAQEVFAAHRDAAGTIAAKTPSVRIAAKPRERLRIGYLSPDFRRHAVALFAAPVLAHHDRARFEVFCYSCHRDEDAMTRELRAAAEHWRDIAALDDDDAVALMRNDDLDVVIDLAGYTSGSRLPLLVHRVAPAQATWLGYLHSTALREVDYRITDAYADPQASEALHTEALMRMPHSQWCYAPAHHADAVPGVRGSGRPMTFGSFNQFWKVSDRCLELWLDVAARVPSSRLHFAGVPRGRASERLLSRIASRGIDAARASIAPRVDTRRYFAALADVDIALDTLPYNGATTTLDALWMGVPVVALTGERSVSRSSASILHTLGLPQLVASSPQEYVDINVRLAQDEAWRSSLRASLRERLRASPLMDAAQFTRDLEACYLRMHARALRAA